jgi:glycerol-3-phosphate acyltransferase PlsY
VLAVGLPLIIAYLIGAVPFGLLVARVAGVNDIRQQGSGNIGATNVVRVAGFKAGIWVYLLDIGKGVSAVLIVGLFHQSLLSRDLFLLCGGLAAVLGHVFPVYLRFKGGKGVNTALGVMLVLLPVETIIAFVVFLIVVLISRFISLGSILGAISLPLVILTERIFFNRMVASVYLYVAVVLALLVIYTHRANIRRLVSGQESRFTLSSGTGNS